MNILQKYWSYVSRITIEQTSSPHNKKLIVALQNGKLVLNTKNANYSFASLHKVFQQALKKVNINQKGNILVLGCGAGSIPTIIYNELQLTPNIDAVEIDQKVIELANTYFSLKDFKKLNVCIDDAKDYVAQTKKQYDLICVDIFAGLNVPHEFLTTSFFIQLKKILDEDGEILINYVAYNFETKKQIQKIENNLSSIFPKINTYRFENINRIFHAV